MIRIVLLGRTGNNIFQYALGRVLAQQHGVPLVLDASWFNAEGWAEVSHFLRLPIQATVIRPFSLGSRAFRNLTGKHFWEYRRFPFIKEPTNDQSFDPRYLSSPADCCLFGYFQSPLYFQGIADELRTELNELISLGAHSPSREDSLSDFASTQGSRRAKILSLAENLNSPASVAVHIRRGDYQHHPCFQVCDLEYYRKSIETMRARIPRARFFVFSDDPDWCRTAFREDDVVIIDSGSAGNNPLHDLHLMSLASHHIIANSTYSWWAAWLGDKPGQQVVMPDRWYARDITAPIEEKFWKLP